MAHYMCMHVETTQSKMLKSNIFWSLLLSPLVCEIAHGADSAEADVGAEMTFNERYDTFPPTRKSSEKFKPVGKFSGYTLYQSGKDDKFYAGDKLPIASSDENRIRYAIRDSKYFSKVYGVHNGRRYFQYIPGEAFDIERLGKKKETGTFTKFIKGVVSAGGKRITVDCAKFYTAQIVHILNYLHSHRVTCDLDFGPSRFRLDTKGYLVLTGFRSAKLQDDPTNVKTAPVSELQYRSPAVLTDPKPYDFIRANWFSAGLVMLQLVRGPQALFPQMRKETRQEYIVRINAERSNHIERELNNFPEELSDLKSLLHRILLEDTAVDDIKSDKWFSEFSENDWKDLKDKTLKHECEVPKGSAPEGYTDPFDDL